MKISVRRNGAVASEITIVQCHGSYEIKYIRTATDHRGQGHASSLIEKAKTKYGSLVAFLEPDGTGLTFEQMEAWYKRHGFKRVKYSFGAPLDKRFKRQWVMYYEQAS